MSRDRRRFGKALVIRQSVLRRSTAPVLLAALATVAGTALAPAALAAPTPPGPVPAAIEGFSSYVPAVSCDPAAKPGVSRFAALVQASYPGTGSSGISRLCSAEASLSEHTEGRAWDWRVNVTDPTQVAQVNDLTGWLLAPDAAGNQAANARRLGLMYMIWNKQILGFYDLSAGWRPYSCSGVTGCHQDHVHFSFGWAGAMGRTSFWTGAVAPADYGPCRGPGQMFAPHYTGPNPVPCPAPGVLSAGSPVAGALAAARGTTLSQGSTGPAVVAVQQALGGTPPDGDFGGTTRDLVLTFQERRGLPATGTVDTATLDSLYVYATGHALTGPPAVIGAISGKYQELGGPDGFLGAPLEVEHPVPRGVAQSFAGGTVYWSGPTGAHVVYGAVLGTYLALGGPGGVAGLPLTDETAAPGGRFNTFQGATIGWTPAGGAHSVYGAIGGKYLALGGPTGLAGLPLTDETGTPDGTGRYNHFTNGASIYWTPATDAHAVYGAIRSTWAASGAQAGPLGYPTADEADAADGRKSVFQHGTLDWNRATGQVRLA